MDMYHKHWRFRKMDTLGAQIRKYRDLRNMTQKQLTEKLGESSGSVIYNWEKGFGRPACEKLVKLCHILDISADELLGCNSMVQRPTATEWEAIKKYRALDEHGREVIDYLIDSEYKRVTTHVHRIKPKMLTVNCYYYPASAGTGNFLDNECPEQILVKESFEAEKADYAILVSGDSMEPTYHNGDKVLVEKCDSVELGEVGIFVVNGEVYIKELGNRCLISHNERYEHLRIGENDRVYCCGRVIGIVEKENHSL
jgi:transcriptional regulator with XRE-family HTH domain